MTGGRPRTPLGTAGKMTTVGQVCINGRWVTAPEGARPTRYRARTRVRGSDGTLRSVERFDRVKGRAETKLRAAVAEKVTAFRGDELWADMSVVSAASIWLAQVGRLDSGLAASTREQYEAAFERYVRGSGIAELTLREANRVPPLRTFVQRVADSHGTGAAKTARTVVSNILRMAVNDGVLEHNAMRQVPPAKANGPTRPSISAKRAHLLGELDDVERDTSRAFTRTERDQLLDFAAGDAVAQERDVVDLVRWMAGTGVRISEALGQLWADVDLAMGTVHVRGTKTDHSDRVLHLPVWLVESLEKRAVHGLPVSGLVFASTRTGERRDRRNTARHLRDVFDRAGFPWATPHSLRRTVATLMDEAGLPLALTADQLNHANPAMTARFYLGRKGDMSRAAQVL
jgi:integrase